MLKTIKLKLDTNVIILFFISTITIIGLVFSGYQSHKRLEIINSQKEKISKMSDTLNTSLSEKNTEIKNLKKEVQAAKSASLVQFTADDLHKDIDRMYPALSKRVKNIIVESILDESLKYGVNPLILYSLIHTESSMRPWIEHKKIIIHIKKKKKYIRAVGLGGVVWEWWGEELKKADIAEVRSDLFDPRVNIRAVAYIYNVFYNKKMHKKASTQDESAMIRYFGGGYKSYFERIDKKVAQIIRQKMYRPCSAITTEKIEDKKLSKGK